MKNTKKGFTLVELLVVIAIVAILATVAIIGYTSFINKAEESNDRTLVAQLNKTLIGGTFETAHDAFEAVRAAGFDVAKIEATAKNQAILWDNNGKQFYYTADDAPTNADSWIVTNDPAKVNATYGIYYVGTADIDSADVTNLIIYTNDPALTISIKAPVAHVERYGVAGTVNVLEVGPNSYYEKGIVVNELNVSSADIVKIYGTVASLKLEAGATVTLEAGSETANLVVNSGEATVDYTADAKVDQIVSEKAEVAEKLETIVPNAPADIIIKEEVDLDKVVDFAGGFGTEAFPYLIATPEQMMNISKHYDTYNYYKVADGVTSLDLTDIGKINLNGSFDGNGVTMVNLTSSLFQSVGQAGDNAKMVIENFDVTVNVLGASNSGALVRKIHNLGETVFSNIAMHGYIEGTSNLASFCNLGGYNGSYTVTFEKATSDVTIFDTGKQRIGGMFAHLLPGDGTVSIKIDEKSGYTGKMSTEGTGNSLFAIGAEEFILNGESVSTDDASYKAYDYTVEQLNVKNPSKEEDGYYVAPESGVSKYVVKLNAQIDSYDAEGNELFAGSTMCLGTSEITDFDAKIINLITDIVFVNDATHQRAYEVNGNVLTVYTGSNDSYETGWVNLQVLQYDEDGDLIAVGNVTLHSIPKHTPAE